MAQIDAKHAFREDIEEFGARTFGPAIFGLLLAMTFAGRTRKWLLVAASLTLVQSRVTCVYSEQLAALRFPGSHAYIDDFFFLDPPFADQTDTWPADSTLIAIEKQSLVRGAKAVALRNGVITNMADNEIESLLACPPPPVSKRN